VRGDGLFVKILAGKIENLVMIVGNLGAEGGDLGD